MKAYRIHQWDDHYENNRSRELKRPEWLPLPNKFDGAGFMELLDHAAGMSHYGAWCLLLAAASRMPTRGLLVGDSGRPYSIKDIARMTRGSVKVFEEALPRLIAIGWVEEIEYVKQETPAFYDVSGSSLDDGQESDLAGSSHLPAVTPHHDAESVRQKGKGKGNPKGNTQAASLDPRLAAASEMGFMLEGKTRGEHRDYRAEWLTAFGTDSLDRVQAVLAQAVQHHAGKRLPSVYREAKASLRQAGDAQRKADKHQRATAQAETAHRAQVEAVTGTVRNAPPAGWEDWAAVLAMAADPAVPLVDRQHHLERILARFPALRRAKTPTTSPAPDESPGSAA